MALRRTYIASDSRKHGSARDRMRLLSACVQGKADMVRKLLAAGVDPNGPEEQLGGPLLYAAAGGHNQILRHLLEFGAKPDIVVPGLGTPLRTAMLVKNHEAAALLREHGARGSKRVEPQESGEEEESRTFWETPVERLRGLPPWMGDHKYYESLLVRASVPQIKQSLLAHPLTRQAPPETACDTSAPDVPQPSGQRLTFATLRGHAWTAVRGGQRLAGQRPFSNEWLAEHLSADLRTAAFVHGHEHVSGSSYWELYSHGQQVRSGAGEGRETESEIDTVMRGEGIFDPDVEWTQADGGLSDDPATLQPMMPWLPEEVPHGFRREDFVEVDTITVVAETE